jgi:hypothetical protein
MLGVKVKHLPDNQMLAFTKKWITGRNKKIGNLSFPCYLLFLLVMICYSSKMSAGGFEFNH